MLQTKRSESRAISQNIIDRKRLIGLSEQDAAMLIDELRSKKGSQFGQDEWVLGSYAAGSWPQPEHPFFLDIGAHDGEDGSNTQLLEMSGWRGVCVEPLPVDFTNRSCKLVEKVVSDGQQVEFRVCPNHGPMSADQLSGIESSLGRWKESTTDCPTKKFQSISALQLLEESKVPKTIDYVSLDVEGAELSILQQWPENYCVRLWSIEHNHEEPKKTHMRKWLEARECKVEEREVDFLAACSCPA
jgi:FkbM family methyltransferase